MNIDNLRSNEAIEACIFNSKMNWADISRIQETHKDRNDPQVYKDYTIFYSSADKATHSRNNNSNHWANNWRGRIINN